MDIEKREIKEFESIFGADDPVLLWIDKQLKEGKTPKQIETDYKAFHILGGLENSELLREGG